MSFLKAPGYQDGHAGYSDPTDEQRFVTQELNALQPTRDWKHTAVIVTYDDSDGWYDHVYSGVRNPSLSPADNLTTKYPYPTSGQCGPSPQPGAPLAAEQGRCGSVRGSRSWLSHRTRRNHVDHHLGDQSSIINLVEFNWGLPGIAGSADQVLKKRDRATGIPFDLAGLFRFGVRREGQHDRTLIRDPVTGQPVAESGGGGRRQHQGRFSNTAASP